MLQQRISLKAAKIFFFTNTSFLKISESLKEGKLKIVVQTPEIEQLRKRIHRILMSSRAFCHTCRLEKELVGSFLIRRKSYSSRSEPHSTAREPHGAQRKKRRIGKERQGATTRERERARETGITGGKEEGE